MTNELYDNLRNQFRKVFEAKWDRTELRNYDDLREKFAFHMADVAVNLGRLAQVYGNPSACSPECFSERTEMFFYHSMPHLVAAAEIYDEIPQVFEEQGGVHDWDSFVDDEVAK